ncbi:MAG: hypothetical protein RIA64_01570 [Rhodospirillales bacterium]
MLPKSKMSVLRAAIREECASLLETGAGRPRQAAKSVLKKKKSLVRQLGVKLAEDALTRIAAREFKKWTTVGASSKQQLDLPGLDASVSGNLPASISVYGSDGEPVYKSLTGPRGATVAEIRQALNDLWKGVEDGRRHATALNDLLKVARKLGATDEMRIADLRGHLDRDAA